ncbi:MAG: anthranilate synthase component 1 [Gemmatimonadales bacterium]
MTPGNDLPVGAVRPLVRRLAGAPDPLVLYRALSDGGTRPNTFLLESADSSGATGVRSLLGVRSALRIEADLSGVSVEAESENGRAALAWLDQRAGMPLEPDGPNRRRMPLHRTPARWADERTRYRQPSPLDLLRLLQSGPRLESRPNEWCHLLAGVLGYDLIDYFEALPPGRPDPLGQPIVEWCLADRLIVVDHQRLQTTVVTTAWGGPGYRQRFHDAARALEALVAAIADSAETADTATPTGPDTGLDPTVDAVLGEREPAVDQDDLAYGRTVSRVIDHLRAGDAYQVVPSRTFSLPCADPLDAYARLRARNPSPYLFYLRGERRTLLGASPETCLRVVGPTREVSVMPIAGTAPRGRRADGSLDPETDVRNEVALRLDRKESAEHLMLVDLARNDVARVSLPGTRAVTRLLAIERYTHVMHLVSEVRGTLAPGIDALEAYAATLNMGTLVGAPKVRAAAILRELEPTRRGCYGGAVGYLTDDGTLETAIVIRSAVVQDGVAHVRAGAGVVLDSLPEREAAETRHKARAVLEAIVREAPVHA